MTIRIKYLAAATGLTMAAIGLANGATAQPVSSQTMAQPNAVAPVTSHAFPGAENTAMQPLPYSAGPPPMTGAVAGTTAADRDGDGIVDGYYTPDGFYHPYIAPTPAPAPRYLSRRGERG
jgi:hypothetical protein